MTEKKKLYDDSKSAPLSCGCKICSTHQSSSIKNIIHLMQAMADLTLLAPHLLKMHDAVLAERKRILKLLNEAKKDNMYDGNDEYSFGNVDWQELRRKIKEEGKCNT